MRTNTPVAGVGPSRMKNMNHPGGDWYAFGGAVTVHEFPLQENSGKMVRWPIAFPWVLTTDPRRETFVQVPEVTVKVTVSPYIQSVFVRVTVGFARPERS
jgi:hypothetical protein